jgi:hypothetical protein
MQQLSKWILLTALSSTALYYGAACGSNGPPAEDEAEAHPELADVIFEGAADEKALAALLAAALKTDPGRGAVIDSPADKALLPPAPIPTFNWHPPGSLAARSGPRQGPPSLLPRAPEEHPTVTSVLVDLLGPERAAYADAAPMSGLGYFLVFSTDVDPKMLRVFTTKTTYTPDAKAWEKLSSAKIWTTLVIASASFADDRLMADGGPFLGESIQFCIEQ